MRSAKSARSQDDLVNLADVQKFVGYSANWWAVALYKVLVLLTGGIVWILGQLCYHETVTLWLLQRCPLSGAQLVHVQFINGHRELVKVHEKPLSGHFRSRPYPTQDVTGKLKGPSVRLITVLLVVYVYNAAHDTFEQLPAMPVHLPSQIRNAKNALQLIEEGHDWSIFNSPGTWQRKDVQLIYGKNDMSSGQPSLIKMAAAVLVLPLFIVQYFELAFLFYARYYQQASSLLLITLLSTIGATYELFKKRQRLFRSVGRPRFTPLIQDGRVRAVSSSRLVPGDVLVVLPGTATCDMVLLQGNCLVEESNLSGEAAQVRKSSFVTCNDDDDDGTGAHEYRPEKAHTNTIFAGTVVEQVWADGNTDEEVLAMVVRTGYRSTMGNMLRQIVAPQQDSRQDSIMMDIWSFCGFALGLHCCIFLIAAVPYFQTRQVSYGRVVMKVLHTIIAAVPVAIPTIIIWINAVCSTRLRAKGISVLNVTKITTAAHVSVVCFDKTGTLTGTVPKLHGMLPVEWGRFTGLQQSAVRWPDRLRQAAALCNSLTVIRKSQVVGDVADKQAFKAVEAHFVKRDRVTLPIREGAATPNPRKPAAPITLQVLKRFDFEPGLMRSGVIATQSEGPPGNALLFVKGAPGMIKPLVRKEDLPPDFDQVLVQYAGQSFRLLALAVGTLHGVSAAQLAGMDQQQAEARCGTMDLLGMLVLSNELRDDSRTTIAALQDRGGIRTLMVTGDYQHTAIAVARGVGMVPPGGPLIIIQSKTELQPRTAQPPARCLPSESTSTPQSGRQSLRAGLSISPEPGSMTRQLRRHKSALRGPQGLSDRPSEKKKFGFSEGPGGPVQLGLLQSLSERALSQASALPQMAVPEASALPQRAVPEASALLQRAVPEASALPQRAGPEVPALHAADWSTFLPHRQSSRVAPEPLPVTHSLLSAADCPASVQFGESALFQRGQSEAGAHVEQTAPALPDAPLGHMEAHDQSEVHVTQQLPDPVILPEASTAAAVEDLSQSDGGQVQNKSCEDLVFMLQSEGRITWGLDPQHALTQLAQGSAQCCVTGPAFEQMLQQADGAVVQTVMSSVAVFARMQGQQKGQVMHLLQRTGLYHTQHGKQAHLPGLGATCMYCGDGINDLVALAAADVGMAVGASHASAAASLSNQHASVQGVETVLRETRSAIVIKLSSIKYLVAYGLLMQLAVNVAWRADGSEFSILQRSTIDFVAITLGMVVGLRKAAPQLTLRRPPERLCMLPNFAALLVTVLIISLLHWALQAYLQRQSFYQNRSVNSESPSLTMVWAVTLHLTLLPLATFTFDTLGFCQMYSRPEIVLLSVYGAFGMVSCIAGPAWFDALDLFHFYAGPVEFNTRTYLIGFCFAAGYALVFQVVRRM